MNRILITFFAYLCSIFAIAQPALPVVKFDRTDSLVRNNILLKKSFYESNNLVCTTTYHNGDSIESLCDYLRYKFDSIQVFYGDKMLVARYSKKSTYYYTWTKKSNIVEVVGYFPDGNIESRLTWTVIQKFDQPENAFCHHSLALIKRKEIYDKLGKVDFIADYDRFYSVDKNYDTSFIPQILIDLKLKADSLVQKGYGSYFFNKYIRFDHARSGIIKKSNIPNWNSLHHEKHYARPFTEYNEENFAGLDLVYALLIEGCYYPFSFIRISKEGEFIYKSIELNNSQRECTTLGLTNSPIKKVYPRKKVVQKFINLYPKFLTEPYLQDIVWRADTINSSFGNIFYRFIFNERNAGKKNEANIYDVHYFSLTSGKYWGSEDSIYYPLTALRN